MVNKGHIYVNFSGDRIQMMVTKLKIKRGDRGDKKIIVSPLYVTHKKPYKIKVQMAKVTRVTKNYI